MWVEDAMVEDADDAWRTSSAKQLNSDPWRSSDYACATQRLLKARHTTCCKRRNEVVRRNRLSCLAAAIVPVGGWWGVACLLELHTA